MPNILDSEPIDIVGLLSRGKLEIPKYQRSYSWTRREITEFLEDLFGSVHHSESWFLGIVYTYHSVDEQTHARRITSLLLDGQQRMTTLFILLKELTLYADIIPDSTVSDEIRAYAGSTLTSLIFETGTPIPRLTLDEANRNEFAQYLAGQTREDANFDFFAGGDFARSHKLLNDGIQIIRDWLEADLNAARGERDEVEHFKKLVQFILYGIELIEIQLDMQASFYNIFENINDRGRRLTDSDKFKNRYCSLIPRAQIAQFENDWFHTSKGIYGLKKDLDKDLFGFYFRSNGINDLEQGGFYRTLRQNIQSREGNDRVQYVTRVWDQLKEMLRLMKDVDNFDLIRLYQGDSGNNLRTTTKVVNVLVRDTWKNFDQYGVLANALFFRYRDRGSQESYLGFLRDLLNAARSYSCAALAGEGANVIRDYTIEIAHQLSEGKSLDDVLAADNGRLDFAGRIRTKPLDGLSIQNNDFSRLLLTFIQAHVNREVIEHYDATQSWTLEHLLPKGWEENWASAGTTDWDKVNSDHQGLLVRQLQLNDLNDTSKYWVQQLLGNKFVLSWRQNNDVRNDSLTDKKARILEHDGGVIMPTVPGGNLQDYETFGIEEILNRTITLGDHLKSALQSKDLPL